MGVKYKAGQRVLVSHSDAQGRWLPATVVSVNRETGQVECDGPGGRMWYDGDEVKPR